MSKTANQVRAELKARGVTLTAWADENGFKLSAVNAVLRGQHQGNYGTAHRIKVALGMKELAK